MCVFNFRESLHPRKLTNVVTCYFSRESIALLLRHEEALQAASNAVGEARGSMPPCEMLRDCLL